MGDNFGKGVILVVGLIFVFGAIYQVLTHPTQANTVVNASASDVLTLEHVFTGRTG